MAMKLQNIQILLIRLALGGLFLHLGVGKINDGWIQNSAPLMESLKNFQTHATGYHLVYLTKIAIPYAPLWSKLMAVGEAAVGISLLIGLLVRFSSAIGIFMILNFHAATGLLYTLNFFGSASAAILAAGFTATMLAGAGRWIGVDQILAKSKPKGIFW
ncbi:MAG: DoxX family protein [Bacteroidota bacterium]